MRHFLFIVLLLLWLPLAAQAQQAMVRSGEHEGYSRLVAPLPGSLDWKVMHAGQDVTFTVSGYDKGYDVSTVYNFISRGRVQDITPLPNGFVIRLGCDCRVASFIDKKQYVVLDITSPGVKRSVAFIPMNTVIDQTRETADTADPQAMDVALPLAPVKPQSRIKPVDLPTLARAPLSETEQESLAEVQRRLTRELSTATTRGLLTPAPGPPLPLGRRAQVDLSAITLPDAPPPIPKPVPPDDVVNNMRVTSSMDVPGIALKADDAQSLSGLTCPANTSLDIVNWADNRPFHQQTGDLRRELYQEFDHLNREAALKLAKLYIHYGFGAEARQILLLDDELRHSHKMLLDIASIFETGIAPPDSMLHALMDCETDVALWAMLARQDLGVEHTVDPRPALLSLNKLPIHLRNFLAPALSRRLLAHGDADAAATALRSLERLPATLPSSAKLAQAEIALDEGHVEKATDGLADVADDNAEHSPEALVALVDTRIAARQPISPETANLVEAYAKELSQTELGPELRRAHVLALARSGQFDNAFTGSKKLDVEDATKLQMRLFEELTASAEDVVFLEYVLERSPQDFTKLPKLQKVALAARLFDLGFAEQAQTILSDIADQPRSDTRQLLAARIALDLSQPMRAQAELIEIAGEEADLLRAKAKQMAGAHAEAHDLYRLANNDEAAVLAAWLADDSERFALSDNTIFGPVLALSDAAVAVPPEVDGMLARGEAALTESSAARQTLLDLLQAPELNVDLTDVTQ